MTEATSPTPESSRRYIQWKEEDIGLLLSDLEQPNHYTKWKENKSGYSKRVGEQVFRNTMNHEAIKFKVRWLESRFKHWHEKLTAPEIEQDQVAINVIRGLYQMYVHKYISTHREFIAKMMKEFPYYDRCKPIFEETDDTTPSPTILVDTNFKKRKLQPIVQR